MSLASFGDTARFAAFAQEASRLKTDLQRLSGELGSGRISDLGAATGGDFAELADIRRGIRLSAVFSQGLAEAATIAEGRQMALERLSAEVEGVGPALLATAGTGRSSELKIHLADAPGRFAHAIETMNTRLAGRSLFSGDAPERPALADPDVILGQLRTIVAGAADAAAAVAGIDAWFRDAGGGFETSAWLGGANGPAPVYVGEGTTIDAGVSARDPSIREVLSGLAMAALAAEGSVPAGPTSVHDMAIAAAGRMMAGEGGLIELRTSLGVAQGRIEAGRVQTEATRAGLELADARITSADPYDTAIDIETVSRQLESLYLLTARISELSLTKYLR